MPKDEWGVKRVCPSCSTRFYDLKNDPMTCPSCGNIFDLESLLGNKSRSTPAEKTKEEPVAAKEPEGDVEDAAVLDDDDDDDADTNDDLLDDDDDDTVNLDDIADVPAEDDDT